MHCFHLLREYNPEDTVYGLFMMGLGNLFGFGFLGTQAQELIQDAKSALKVQEETRLRSKMSSVIYIE